MAKKREFPRFCDPSEFSQDKGKSNHGRTIYVRCLECDGPAYFDVEKRYGQCYSCSKVHKLHKHYKNWSDDDIFDAIGIDASVYHRQVGKTTETIQPYPLSQRARDYISSRGISQKTLLLFRCFQEVERWGKKWLYWRNIAGGCELREIFGKEKRSQAPKTYSRFDLRLGKRFVVGEGIFDILSYAQLHGYNADTYIALNSTTSTKLLISDMPNWDVEHVTLALDQDKAGKNAIRELCQAFEPIMEVTVDLPEKVGQDWNDILMETR